MPETNQAADRVYKFLLRFPDEVHLNEHIAKSLSLNTKQVSDAIGTILKWGSGTGVARKGRGKVVLDSTFHYSEALHNDSQVIDAPQKDDTRIYYEIVNINDTILVKRTDDNKVYKLELAGEINV